MKKVANSFTMSSISSNQLSPEESNDKSDNFTEVLDDVEVQIDKLRDNVLRLETEKGGLIDLLETIGGSLHSTSLSDLRKEETLLEIERLKCRLGDVVCGLEIRRLPSQKEALKKVDIEIVELVGIIEKDVSNKDGEQKCKSYLAACGGEVEGNVSTSEKFEKMVLDCSVEDQKRIKQRLAELLAQIHEIRSAEIAENYS